MYSSIHRNTNVILTKSSSLVALEVVILTTSDANSVENFVKTAACPFHLYTIILSRKRPCQWYQFISSCADRKVVFKSTRTSFQYEDRLLGQGIPLQRPSHLYNGSPYTVETAFLYIDAPLVLTWRWSNWPTGEQVVLPHRAHNAIITSLLRRNDVVLT